MVVSGVRLGVVECGHHFWAQPDILIRMDRLDASFTRRRDESQVFRR